MTQKSIRWYSALFSIFCFSVQAEEPREERLPVVTAHHTDSPIVLDGKLDEEAWSRAQPIKLEKVLKSGEVVQQLSTVVRTLWSDEYLYISYVAPYTELTTFDPPIFQGKRVGLWDADVVEVFINVNPDRALNEYTEYQVAPTGEKLDLSLRLPERDFCWNSGFEAAVHLDTDKKIWTTELRIPLSALGKVKPAAGMRWRINYYRHAISDKVFLAWNPTQTDSAHTPERFGILEFIK